jgi:hypothetical protein
MAAATFLARRKNVLPDGKARREPPRCQCHYRRPYSYGEPKPSPDQMKTKTAKLDADKKQAAVFRKAARELGCGESEDRFKEASRTIAKPKENLSRNKRVK